MLLWMMNPSIQQVKWEPVGATKHMWLKEIGKHDNARTEVQTFVAWYFSR